MKYITIPLILVFHLLAASFIYADELDSDTGPKIKYEINEHSLSIKVEEIFSVTIEKTKALLFLQKSEEVYKQNMDPYCQMEVDYSACVDEDGVELIFWGGIGAIYL